jgi:hypothetical protein
MAARTADLDFAPDEPQLPVQPVTVQHPALGGDIQAEIRHRTADPTSEGRFTRIFHLSGLGYGPHHPAHLANAGEVVGDAIRRGLHPKGDVHLVDVQEHDEPRSQYSTLTYDVDVVPAVLDTHASTTITPHDVAAAGAEAQTAGVQDPKGAATGTADAPVSDVVAARAADEKDAAAREAAARKEG